ncbi:hypothetical protein Angca_008366 [Angiostrongylus cantonensis]|nr:hypothetical protein Angca_008366 [Angiostrongylus cantonensis]
MAWFRKRFSYYESMVERCPTDEEPSIKLRGYRVRTDEQVRDKEKRKMSNNEHIPLVKCYAGSTSSRSSDISAALNVASSLMLSEKVMAPTPVNGMLTRTPVLRRRRSTVHLAALRRNYRIMAPDESIMILEQHSGLLDGPQLSPKNKILRRKSNRREKDIISPLPMVITPPVLLNRTQSCSLCCQDRSRLHSDEMPPTSLTSSRFSEEDPARLSFVSSSTGYSSARSSLRSSDGGEDHINRDSGIASHSSSLSLSSSRRSALLSGGALSQIDRIAIELFDTEKTYVDDLYAVIQGYLNFLVDHRDELGVTLDDVSSLFGCIERIYAFNRKLLQQLDLADLDCVKMSRCFVDNAGKFEDYIVYCTNYHRMIATLAQLQQLPQMAAALAQRQSALGHALPLSAYLLKPVQRVLKYHLFIEQTANLLAYGELLLEASFRQAGSKTTRLLFLFEEMLLIVKQRNSNYICKDYIMSSNLMLNESIYPEEPLAFQVLSFDNPRAQYIFLASSSDQKKMWMIELKRMMLDHYGIEIPEKTKQLMLNMDNTQRVAFGRPEFAEVSVKNHKRIPKYLEKRRKSVEKGRVEQNRRRSLSASRLLGASNTSLVSDSSRYKLFDATDLVPKCSCHLASTPGPSGEPLPALVSAVSKVPVLRTVSASTIVLSGEVEATSAPPAPEAVVSSRSRYNMARNKRSLMPKCDVCNLYRAARIDFEEIDETFDELFKELVLCGDISPTTQAKNASGTFENATDRVDLQEVLAWRQQVANKNRSKSLTRLDDFTSDVDNPQDPSASNAEPTSSEMSQNSFGPERRFSKVDQLKRLRSKKYTTGECSEHMRINSGRLMFSDRTPTIPEVISPRSGIPLIDDDTISPRRLSARQRTPLTVEQVAELDAMVPTPSGVVKSMIRQIENTGS